MEKVTTVSEELIRGILSCDTYFEFLRIQDEIKRKYPSLNELEVGKWYTDGYALGIYEGNSRITGFWNGKWDYGWIINKKEATEATNGEVERALTAEAIKRGFVRGALIVDKSTPYSLTGGYYYNFGVLRALVVERKKPDSLTMSVTIFKDGKWAEKANIFQAL